MNNAMTPYYTILDRDVPIIVAKSKELARMGVCGPLEVFYKHERIIAQSTLIPSDPTEDGWKPSGVIITADIPWSNYYHFLAQRLTRIPLYA